MMKMSVGIALLSDACAAQASPPRPVPELVPPVSEPPLCVPPASVPMPDIVLPVCVPPVSVPAPPVSVPEPLSNTELLPLLPQPLASDPIKPADNMQIAEAFPYLIESSL
jgi:hypothetical protein